MAKRSLNSPPGCIIQRRGGFYWKLPKSLQDAFEGRSCVPLLQPGQTRGATKNRRVAESVRRRMWRDLAGGDAAPSDSDAVIEAFEAHVALATSSRRNAKESAGKIRSLVAFAGGRQKGKGLAVDEISAETVEAFLADLRGGPDARAANTIYNYYTAIKKFSDWGNEPRRAILAADLVEGVPRPAQGSAHLRYLTKHQAAIAWHTVHRFDPAIERHFILAMWTGARRSEISSIAWPDFFVGSAGRDWLRIRNFKTNSERAVPVAPRLRRRLIGWGFGLRGKKTGPVATPAWAADTLGHRLGDLVADHPDGMPVFGELGTYATGNGWHLLRHTFASWAAMAGVDIRVIKEWMGHKSIQTTMQYAAVRPTTSAHLIDRL